MSSNFRTGISTQSDEPFTLATKRWEPGSQRSKSSSERKCTLDVGQSPAPSLR